MVSPATSKKNKPASRCTAALGLPRKRAFKKNLNTTSQQLKKIPCMMFARVKAGTGSPTLRFIEKENPEQANNPDGARSPRCEEYDAKTTGTIC